MTGLQIWMTLGLFGPDRAWQAMLDDRPVVSGAHPLHLYFGVLGARALYRHAGLCCYDPAFQAGYPKTPVFDGGSRPAEFFLALVRGEYRPAAYKIGLAGCLAAVPLCLYLAARGAGLGGPACLVAAALGLVVCWGSPCREALEAGDLDLLVGGVAILLFVGALVRFDDRPRLAGWAGLLLAGWLGWFVQPAVMVLALPLVLVFYLSAGPRHALGWHVALLAVLLAAVGGNIFWLPDWALSWWVRVPLQEGTDLLRHRTLRAVWDAPLWGGEWGRGFVVGVIGSAVGGVVLLNRAGRRATARLFGLGAAACLALAVSGVTWKPLARLGSAQLLVPSLWFAAVPAASFAERVVASLVRWLGGTARPAGYAAAGMGVMAVGGAGLALPGVCNREPPLRLELGLGPERQALVDALRTRAQPDARILWEDRRGGPRDSRWEALLPLLTGRSFVGGLDPEGWIEHSFPRLEEGVLAGRPVGEYTDAALDDYCRRYAVAWAVCWSGPAVARFRSYRGAGPALPVEDGGRGMLFALGPRTLVLRGRAKVISLDGERVVLSDVIPEDGKVVLSLHYQAGMRAAPGRVRVERDPDPFDPIPLVRLRVPGPVARVTLRWEER